ncbi:PilW family protein [Inhella sp.]|uniref:PilW family protein n=1 Tax=Inhella sp. TaxID=1921806 RepID=UPI0035B3BC7A
MARHQQRGFSLVELMVGITVGLIAVAGASTVAVHQLTEHKRLALEAQTQQELRAAGEIMARELRKAGSWGSPELGLWSERNPAPRVNPYTELIVGDDGRRIEFSYSKSLDMAADFGTDNATVPAEDERRGFRLKGQQLEFKLGSGGYQPLTDPATLVITHFEAKVIATSSQLASRCFKPCEPGNDQCPPQLTVRSVQIAVEGHARHDSQVKRRLNFTTRLSADQLSGSCQA